MSDMARQDVDEPPPRLQFGLRTLLALPVVVAVALTLLKFFAVWGVLVVFVATVALGLRSADKEKAAVRRFAADLMWGIVLPILCLLYEPGLFRNAGRLGVLAYLAIGSQMLLLLAWLTVGRCSRWLAATLAGALSVGVLVAAAVGISLLPLAFIGMVFLIGILGLTPWITAYVFGRSASQAYSFARGSNPWQTRMLFVLGVGVAVAVPGLLYLAFGEPLSRWIASTTTL